MKTVDSSSFADLVSFDLGSMPASVDEVHGTTVLALRFDQGVAMIADRRATMGNLIMFEHAEKIEALDDSTVVAISGAYARSLEVCRFLKHAFKYYERRNLYEVSAEGKLMEISRALAGNLPMAMQGIGLFLPIAGTYDRRKDTFGVYFFDTAGAKFQGADYACAGSGSERIRGVFEYIARTKGGWATRPQEDVLHDALTMLDLAAEMDSATGGFRKILPSITLLTRDGVRSLSEDEIRPMVQSVLG